MSTAGYYQHHHQQPPPTMTSPAPSSSQVGPPTAASPIAPVPPPTKKQRSTAESAAATATTPSPLGPSETQAIDQMVDDGIKKRREELRRLQDMQRKRRVPGLGSAYPSRTTKPITTAAKNASAPAFHFGAGAASTAAASSTTTSTPSANAPPPKGISPNRPNPFAAPRAVPNPVNAATVKPTSVPPRSAYARNSMLYGGLHAQKAKPDNTPVLTAGSPPPTKATTTRRPAPTPSTQPPPTQRQKPSTSPETERPSSDETAGNAYLAHVLNGDNQTDDDMLVTPMKPTDVPPKNKSVSNNFGAAAATTKTTEAEKKKTGVARRLKLDPSGQKQKKTSPSGIPRPTATSAAQKQIPLGAVASGPPPTKKKTVGSPPDSVLRAADQALASKEGEVAPANRSAARVSSPDAPPLVRENLTTSPPDSILRAADQVLEIKPTKAETTDEPAKPSKKAALREMRQVAETPVKAKEDGSKKDVLRQMRQVAETPVKEGEKGVSKKADAVVATKEDNGNSSSMHLRLVRELKQAKEETSEALRDVARLESELAQEKTGKSAKKNDRDDRSNNSTDDILKTVLELAERDGEKAAVKWAEETLRSTKKGSAFLSTPSRSRAQPSFADTARSAGLSTPGALSILTSGAGSDGGVRLQQSSPSPVKSNGAYPKGKRSTPFPRRRTTIVELGLDFEQEDVTGGNGDINKVSKEFLVSAARVIPDEYGSTSASYFVRRPYLPPEEETRGTKEGSMPPWEQFGVIPADEYAENATASQPETLEVVATIAADGSVLVLHGMSSMRRGTPRWGTQNGGIEGRKKGRPSYDWEDIRDVGDMGRSLGCVYYVDRDGSEREYLLDKIFDEAFSTREAYCSSLLSAASALQALPISRKPDVPPTPAATLDQMLPLNKESVNVNNVATTNQSHPQPFVQQKPFSQPPMQQKIPEPKSPNLPSDPPKNDTQTDAMKGPPPDVQPKAEKVPPPSVPSKGDVSKKPLTPEVNEAPNANDILVSMIVFIVSTVFRIIWFLLVRLPLKILSTTIMLGLMGAMFLVIWLCIADDNGASSIGAGIDFGFNTQRIF